mgnify:CR=1 FL=1
MSSAAGTTGGAAVAPRCLRRRCARRALVYELWVTCSAREDATCESWAPMALRVICVGKGKGGSHACVNPNQLHGIYTAKPQPNCNRRHRYNHSWSPRSDNHGHRHRYNDGHKHSDNHSHSTYLEQSRCRDGVERLPRLKASITHVRVAEARRVERTCLHNTHHNQRPHHTPVPRSQARQTPQARQHHGATHQRGQLVVVRREVRRRHMRQWDVQPAELRGHVVLLPRLPSAFRERIALVRAVATVLRLGCGAVSGGDADADAGGAGTSVPF